MSFEHRLCRTNWSWRIWDEFGVFTMPSVLLHRGMKTFWWALTLFGCQSLESMCFLVGWSPLCNPEITLGFLIYLVGNRQSLFKPSSHQVSKNKLRRFQKTLLRNVLCFFLLCSLKPSPKNFAQKNCSLEKTENTRVATNIHMTKTMHSEKRPLFFQQASWDRSRIPFWKTA